jgi:hypothetical protein
MRTPWSRFTCRCFSGGLSVPGQQGAGECVTLQAAFSPALILQTLHPRRGGNTMAVERTVTTRVERPRESHDVLLQDELAILLRVSRATIERRRRLVIDHTHQSGAGLKGGRAMRLRMRRRSHPNAQRHEPG